MSSDPVRAIADAVLYEGYLLWPYRRSAMKNQQRFTFGGVYPRGWPEDRSRMSVECLVWGEPELEVTVRFLQLVRRRLFDVAGAPVDELLSGGELHLAWDEATERELGPGRFEIDSGREVEQLATGIIERSWERLEGEIELSSALVRPGLHRIRVRIANHASWDGRPRAQTLYRTLCSTHAVLRACDGGRFVSSTDPPPELAQDAGECRHEGLWPVLVGDPSTMLAAPIILEDYPRVAPESPGDMFDGGEIDQLLILNILALTDDEKAEMAASDPRARKILERAQELGPERLMALHGRWGSVP